MASPSANIEMGAENRALTHRKKVNAVRKEKALKVISEMSISGLNRFAATSNPRIRLFWLIIFIFGLFGFIYNLVAISKQFIEAPLLTQMNYEYKPFTWPHVTFCNPTNPIAFWKIPDSKTKWKTLIDKAKSYKNLTYHSTLPIKILDQYLAMSSLSPADFYNIDVSSLVLQMRIVIQQDMIATSSGEFDQFIEIENVTNLFFKQLGSSRFPMLCFNLRLEKLLGSIEDVKNLADVSLVSIMAIMDKASYLYYNFGYEKRKMKLYFNIPNTTLQTSDIYAIYAGTDSEFTITESYLQRKRNCQDHNYEVGVYDPYLETWHTCDGGYEDCRQFMSQDLFVKTCKCYNPFLPIYRISKEKPRLCLNMSLYSVDEMHKNIDCMNRVYVMYKTHESFGDRLSKNCIKFKIPKCQSTRYTYVPSIVSWDSETNAMRTFLTDQQVKSLPNSKANDSAEFLFENLVSIKLRRKRRTVFAGIEEYEYPTSQFLSDFGGILGLWLGFSLIGFFELIELVMVVTAIKEK